MEILSFKIDVVERSLMSEGKEKLIITREDLPEGKSCPHCESV